MSIPRLIFVGTQTARLPEAAATMVRQLFQGSPSGEVHPEPIIVIKKEVPKTPPLKRKVVHRHCFATIFLRPLLPINYPLPGQYHGSTWTLVQVYRRPLHTHGTR